MGINQARPNIKYLGLPSVWGRSKAAAYGFLLEKMAAKVQGWKNNLLSHAGREVLIKAIVQAIPSYAMACFFFPQNFFQKMDVFIRNHWWKRDPRERGIHWEK